MPVNLSLYAASVPRVLTNGTNWWSILDSTTTMHRSGATFATATCIHFSTRRTISNSTIRTPNTSADNANMSANLKRLYTAMKPPAINAEMWRLSCHRIISFSLILLRISFNISLRTNEKNHLKHTQKPVRQLKFEMYIEFHAKRAISLHLSLIFKISLYYFYIWTRNTTNKLDSFFLRKEKQFNICCYQTYYAFIYYCILCCRLYCLHTEKRIG